MGKQQDRQGKQQKPTHLNKANISSRSQVGRGLAISYANHQRPRKESKRKDKSKTEDKKKNKRQAPQIHNRPRPSKHCGAHFPFPRESSTHSQTPANENPCRTPYGKEKARVGVIVVVNPSPGNPITHYTQAALTGEHSAVIKLRSLLVGSPAPAQGVGWWVALRRDWKRDWQRNCPGTEGAHTTLVLCSLSGGPAKPLNTKI